MPIYAYKCESCENTFEVYTTIKDRDKPALGLCGLCDGPVNRVISYGGFQKGAGAWESNNYDFTVSELQKHNDAGKK